MAAPLLRPVSAAVASVRSLLPDLPEGLPAFVVVAEGDHDGHRFATGDILVCRGEAVHGHATVLVPSGHGRPRLGSVFGTTLRGDAGEPCSSARWRAAGALVACHRRGPHGWVVHLLGRGEGPQAATAASQPALEAPAAMAGAERPAKAQLSLFAA